MSNCLGLSKKCWHEVWRVYCCNHWALLKHIKSKGERYILRYLECVIIIGSIKRVSDGGFAPSHMIPHIRSKPCSSIQLMSRRTSFWQLSFLLSFHEPFFSPLCFSQHWSPAPCLWTYRGTPLCGVLSLDWIDWERDARQMFQCLLLHGGTGRPMILTKYPISVMAVGL